MECGSQNKPGEASQLFKSFNWAISCTSRHPKPEIDFCSEWFKQNNSGPSGFRYLTIDFTDFSRQLFEYDKREIFHNAAPLTSNFNQKFSSEPR